MVGVDHRQLSENALLDMDIAILALREVPTNAPQRIIYEAPLERRLAQGSC